jgi:hypothetical protein
MTLSSEPSCPMQVMMPAIGLTTAGLVQSTCVATSGDRPLCVPAALYAETAK